MLIEATGNSHLRAWGHEENVPSIREWTRQGAASPDRPVCAVPEASVGEDASLRRGPVVVRRNHPTPPFSGGKIMMGKRKKKLGRFKRVQHLASTVAIAILAVSPAIAPMASPHLDVIGLAVTEAVEASLCTRRSPLCPLRALWRPKRSSGELERSPWYRDWSWVAHQLAYGLGKIWTH